MDMNTAQTQEHGTQATRGPGRTLARLALFAAGLTLALGTQAATRGWLSWRGPEQTGVSREAGLPERLTLDGGNHLWSADFPGKSTPVVADGRLYVMGYVGEGADLQEGVACFDAETVKPLWRRLFNDYLSDTIYLRYAT